MFCHACGTRLNPGAKFCLSCGAQTTPDGTTGPVAGVQQPPPGGAIDTSPRAPTPPPVNPVQLPPVDQSLTPPIASSPAGEFPAARKAPVPSASPWTPTNVAIAIGAAVGVVALGIVVATNMRSQSSAAPPAPVATAAPRSMEAPTAASAEARWQDTLRKLDGVWDKDWPSAISLIDAFRATAPEHDESKQKLYVALVAYGQVLNDGGDTPKATAQWVRARDLLPGKADAPRLLTALTPIPTTAPPTAVPTNAPAPQVSTQLPGAARADSAIFGMWSAWGTKGTGPGQFDGPRGIAVDSQGNVWVSEFGNHRIQKFSASGQSLGTTGRQGAQSGQMDQPFGLAIDVRGALLVAEWGNNRVQRLGTSSLPAYVWGSPSGEKSAARGEFNYPQGIAISAQGTMYVTDTGNNRVQVFAPSGQLQAVWGQRGDAPGQFYAPDGIAVDAAGNVYVAEYGNNRVQVLSPDGRPLTSWGSKGNGTTQFSGAAGLALDGSGNVYVADQGNGRILKFSGRGEPSTSWRVGGNGTGAGQFNTPVGLAVGADGSVYVTDFGNNRVQRFTPP